MLGTELNRDTRVMRDDAARPENLSNTPRLPDLCEDLLLLIVWMHAVKDFGGHEYGSFRRKVMDLLAAFERKAREAHVPEEDIQDAKFGLVAFIDETVLSSKWRFKDQWESEPLQLTYFKIALAGELFFDRLEHIRQQARAKLEQARRGVEADPEPIRRQMEAKADLLEVYYLCMALGFEGKYRVLGLAKLHALKQEVADEIRQLRSRTPSGLSDNWQPERPEWRPDRAMRQLVILGSALVATVFLYYLVLWFRIGSAAGRVLHGLVAGTY